MKKHRRGFTLIEVVLFLGLTSALFLGIAVGVQNSIFQQRYNDSVQSFAEFLRSVYSQVSNVQNEKYGRTGKAIYGKVVTFDVDNSTGEERNLIKTYNLIGDIQYQTIEEVDTAINTQCGQSESVIDRLCALNASVMFKDGDGLGGGSGFHTVGFVETYEPRWDARIQTTAEYDGGYELFRGMMIITHSPSSGNISTYVVKYDENEPVSLRSEAVAKILDQIKSCESEGSTCNRSDNFNPFNLIEGSAITKRYLSAQVFRPETIDFCVNPNGLDKSTIRRDIRIESGTHNASGVEVIVEERNPDDQMETGELNRCAM